MGNKKPIHCSTAQLIYNHEQVSFTPYRRYCRRSGCCLHGHSCCHSTTEPCPSLWRRFHGNESPCLRLARKDSQPTCPRYYLLAQAYQEGPTCQPSDQEVLLRELGPQRQASTFHKGNQDGKQVGRNRRCRQKVQCQFGKVLN